MLEFFTAAFGDSLFAASPWVVLARIIAAALLGGAVAWIHSRTVGTEPGTGFAMQSTLVLLSALIAMVTQVIGDNVARAFSLVGALSIVRFRTVVRDTRDTAFVIFSVAVGMAVGALAPWVAIMGVLVIGAAAFLLARMGAGVSSGDELPYLLVIRANPAWNPEANGKEILDRQLAARQLVSVRTAKQGASLDHAYGVALSEKSSPQELVQSLYQMEGIQEVKLMRQGTSEESTRL
jgi:uncharacterized membrane protein YhiD involved in acid resistance